MKKIVLVLWIGLIAAGCGRNQSGKGQQDISGVPVEITTAEVITPPDSGAIRLTPTNGIARIKLNKKADQMILIEFESGGHRKLSAQLFPDETGANIRFSQIFLPDGTMDGPFGKDLTYELKKEGLYQLSIHESLMAGDPWSGKLTVEIRLTD